MRCNRRIVIAVSVVMAGTLACSGSNSRAIASRSPSPNSTIAPFKIGQYGGACRSGTWIGPISYSVSDIGKPGVPHVSLTQLALIHHIDSYFHGRILRFVTLPADGISNPERFVVYDSSGNDGCSNGDILIESNPGPEYYPWQPPTYEVATPIGGTPFPWSTPTPK